MQCPATFRQCLVGENDILLKSGGMEEPEEDEGEVTEEDVIEEGTSSTFRLKIWNKRKGKNLEWITMAVQHQ